MLWMLGYALCIVRRVPKVYRPKVYRPKVYRPKVYRLLCKAALVYSLHKRLACAIRSPKHSYASLKLLVGAVFGRKQRPWKKAKAKMKQRAR